MPMDITKISYDQALKFATKAYADHGKDLLVSIPNFERNFRMAQSKATLGNTKRKDMPVIMQKDIKDLQKMLRSGNIHVDKPFAVGAKTETIRFSMERISVRNLTPIQQQIYFDKVILAQAGEKLSQTMNFLKGMISVVSSDHRIIDGHHRFLSAMLIDPDLQIRALVVNLPIAKLLPLSLHFSDLKKNTRKH